MDDEPVRQPSPDTHADEIAELVEEVAIEAAEAPIGLDEVTLEALLFVAEKPLSRKEIATLAGVDRDEVDARLGDLEVALQARGLRLVASGDRVELATAPAAGRLIARYLGVDVVRLSPAALETLAIVAYQQPVTKSAVERIRGVDSDYSIRTLLHRRLVVELGRSEAAGRPILYGTGFEFLERFGLTSLDELPVLDSLVADRLTDEASAGRSLTGSPALAALDAAAPLAREAHGDAPPQHPAGQSAGPAAAPDRNGSAA
jgi:segregation and condensation protein B